MSVSLAVLTLLVLRRLGLTAVPHFMQPSALYLCKPVSCAPSQTHRCAVKSLRPPFPLSQHPAPPCRGHRHGATRTRGPACECAFPDHGAPLCWFRRQSLCALLSNFSYLHPTGEYPWSRIFILSCAAPCALMVRLGFRCAGCNEAQRKVDVRCAPRTAEPTALECKHGFPAVGRACANNDHCVSTAGGE